MQFLPQQTKWACLVATVTVSAGVIQAQEPAGMMSAPEKVIDYQYRFASIDIPVASAHEPTRSSFSLKRALDYIEDGAEAWSKHRKCVSCHTTGTYMVIRPALTPFVGKASEEWRRCRDAILPQLEETRRLTEAAYSAGDISYLAVLEASRGLIEGRQQMTTVGADLRRAEADLDRGIGRSRFGE